MAKPDIGYMSIKMVALAQTKPDLWHPMACRFEGPHIGASPEEVGNLEPSIVQDTSRHALRSSNRFEQLGLVGPVPRWCQPCFRSLKPFYPYQLGFFSAAVQLLLVKVFQRSLTCHEFGLCESPRVPGKKNRLNLRFSAKRRTCKDLEVSVPSRAVTSCTLTIAMSWCSSPGQCGCELVKLWKFA